VLVGGRVKTIFLESRGTALGVVVASAILAPYMSTFIRR